MIFRSSSKWKVIVTLEKSSVPSSFDDPLHCRTNHALTHSSPDSAKISRKIFFIAFLAVTTSASFFSSVFPEIKVELNLLLAIRG